MAYKSTVPTPTSSPQPPYCYGCPQLSTSYITLSDQAPSREIIYDFCFNCLQETNLIHNWWTSATDWLIVDPPQGFGFDSQTFAVTVSLGDTSSLAPGEYGEWVKFHDDWVCDMAWLWVSYRHPPPEFFCLTDLEDLRVTHPRSDLPYQLVYRLRYAPGSSAWGHTYDRENRFYDGVILPREVVVEAFAHAGYSPRPGDDLRLTHDGGRDFHIYLPAFTGYTELYVADSGATYCDHRLTILAQAALPPTPSTTPTPVGYCTPSPTPSISPTPPGYRTPTPIPGAPSVEPASIVLTDREPSRTVTYHMLWTNAGMPGVLNGWWTSSTDWLVVDPPRGLGFDSQSFQVTVSLGDTSSLGPGIHREMVIFHDDWDCNASLGVEYVIPTPTPIPTITPAFLVLDSGDFDGDGTAEIAVFRPATGLWAMRGLSRFYFGLPGDIPVSGDYAGEGTAAAAIYRPSTALWAIRSLTRVYTGIAGGIPVPGDYAGDGSCDIAVFRDGLWMIRSRTRVWFGRGGDLPVFGDYAGDGRAGIAVFRGESNLWAVRDFTRCYFGAAGDRPVPGDYPGDGFRVPAVYRPATGLWAVRDWTRLYFGRGGDYPVPAAFAGAGYDDPAVFRPATGLWAVRGQTRLYYGATGDLPTTR